MKVRIAKFLAERGVGSRRAAEKLVESGAVSVNGATVSSPVFFVDGTEKITVSGRMIKPEKETRLYAFHKPVNTLATASDPSGRRTIYDVLPKRFGNLKYIGRLDYKTTGLLLLTNDGELARRLTLPENHVKRVYIAKLHPKKFGDASVSGARSMTALKKFLSPTSADDSVFDILRTGAKIGGVNYAPMRIDLISRYPLNVKITLTEGKKNEIRTAFDYIGLPVAKLHRVSYGEIKLGNLSAGKIIELDKREIERVCGNIRDL
ncbi:MAG: rRNA pseudouridine synthase [Rickettsiales bacterium]|jgi:23S rRNA pseudouridine2605 synthase|nr:rRNA pseudouridine synthase [Rickettsiales bacterium]